MRAIRDAINHRLPEDVRLLEVADAPPDFHSRHDALWKEYLYRWSRDDVFPPREAPFLAPISARATAALMRAAAAPLPGTRDFGVFGVQRKALAGESTIRTLRSVSIEEEGPLLSARICGDGFLRGMARSICGVLAETARGRVPPERMALLLAKGERKWLSPKAMARGLTLVRVVYGE